MVSNGSRDESPNTGYHQEQQPSANQPSAQHVVSPEDSHMQVPNFASQKDEAANIVNK